MPEALLAPNVSIVQPPFTDAQNAQAIRDGLSPLLKQVCELFDRARRDGLVVNFSLGTDPYGRSQVQNLTVVKPL